MKRDNLEFGDALRLLAERAGVSLRERDPAKDESGPGADSIAEFLEHAMVHRGLDSTGGIPQSGHAVD